uniref:Uncharacterized protein n=1 Tax=Plectus sambesii TaxID=2011161 RepID=A0A914V9B6_9BILA
MTDESVRSLLIAARTSDLETIESLIRRDPSIHIGSDYDGRTALHTAASYGNCDAVRLLLDLGASPHTRTIDGATALNSACSAGHDQIVRLLLEGGAQVNPSCQITSALHEAAACGSTECCTLLVAFGSKLEMSDCNYGTPLHCACYFGHAAVAKVLLDAGANVNARMNHRTPLHYAVERHSSNETLTLLLLAYGASPWIENNAGRRPAEVSPENTVTYRILRWLEGHPRSLQEWCRLTLLSAGCGRFVMTVAPVGMRRFLSCAEIMGDTVCSRR